MADISSILDGNFDEPEDGADSGDTESRDFDASGYQPENDQLSQFQYLEKLQKFAQSQDVCSRGMATSVLLEIFREENPETIQTELPTIMEIMAGIANDTETAHRTDLVHQIPNLAAACAEIGYRVPAFNAIIVDYLLPLVIKYLADTDNQVRKSTHATLLTLMEQGLVPLQAIETQVCPQILHYTYGHNLMEHHTGIIALMGKMVPLLGRDVTERLFLERFAKLCASPLFYVRKTCASAFGEYCAVVGKAAYEQVLFPCFIELCSDEVWSVRKACAEVVLTVSCACSPELRRSVLAPAFVKLLQDHSRWVRMSAFQTLGPFISTFADPSITGLAFNQRGELVLINPAGTEFRIDSPAFTDANLKAAADFKQRYYQTQEYVSKRMNENFDSDNKYSSWVDQCYSSSSDIDITNCNNIQILIEDAERPSGNDIQDNKQLNADKENDQQNIVDDKRNAEKEDNLEQIKDGINSECLDNDIDLPNDDIDEDDDVLLSSYIEKEKVEDLSDTLLKMDIKELLEDLTDSLSKIEPIKEEETSEEVTTTEEKKIDDEDNIDELNKFNYYQYWHVSPELPLDPNIVNSCKSSGTRPEDKFANLLKEIDFNHPNVSTSTSPILKMPNSTTPSEIQQDIVPQLLIDHFTSMTDPNLANSVDNDMTYHCAFSLPAVALTLGRNNWYLLKKTCYMLASDMQYKVRRTVASSLHELALILGQDMTTEHLLPIFDDFIKDLDEVRIGILMHLAHFLKLISPEKRFLYLPALEMFLKSENISNWRFREELANQLLLAVPLFTPIDASKHIAFLAQELLCDKVFAVRQAALALVTELVRYVSGEPNLTSYLLFKLAEEFAHSKRWVRRQAFALLCSRLISKNALPPEQFATIVMPHLLDLSWDPVPNVRLAVSRTLARDIVNHEYFADVNSEQHEPVNMTLRRLQFDKDRDVRQYALPLVTN